MLDPEILKEILAGREFRPAGGVWRSIKYSSMIDVKADYELRPTAPEFSHWHMLPGWANRWVAMDNHGAWYSYEFEPEAETHTWNGRPHLYEAIPSGFSPSFKGDWRDSKIENPNAPGVWMTREKLGDAIAEGAANCGTRLDASAIGEITSITERMLGL